MKRIGVGGVAQRWLRLHRRSRINKCPNRTTYLEISHVSASRTHASSRISSALAILASFSSSKRAVRSSPPKLRNIKTRPTRKSTLWSSTSSTAGSSIDKISSTHLSHRVIIHRKTLACRHLPIRHSISLRNTKEYSTRSMDRSSMQMLLTNSYMSSITRQRQHSMCYLSVVDS